MAEVLDVAALYRGSRRTRPSAAPTRESLLPAREAVLEQGQVGGEDAAVSRCRDAVPGRAGPDRRQGLRRAGVADRRVVLALLGTRSSRPRSRLRQPADAQPGEPRTTLEGHVRGACRLDRYWPPATASADGYVSSTPRYTSSRQKRRMPRPSHSACAARRRRPSLGHVAGRVVRVVHGDELRGGARSRPRSSSRSSARSRSRGA